MIGLSGERRRRLTHRALPALGGLALVAGAAGMVVGSQTQSGSQRTAGEFTQAWERGDYDAMYDMLDDASREVHSRKEFQAAYQRAAATATATGVEAGDPEGERDGSVTVPVEVETRVFGPVRANLRLPVHDEQVIWGPLLAFPGLRRGEALARESEPPERATLLSRNRKVLAEGPADARSSPLEAIAGSITGTLMPEETRAERRALWARGFPRDWPTGQNGLEHAFEDRLAGRPGRAAVRRGPRDRGSTAAGGAARADDDRHASPGGGRDGAGGPLRGHRRARPAQRRDPRAGGAGVLGAPAAGVDVQDRDHDGGARAGPGEAVDGVPGRDVRADRRRGAAERERRVVRRDASGTASPTRATRSSGRWA